jgi:hypothetical protein
VIPATPMARRVGLALSDGSTEGGGKLRSLDCRTDEGDHGRSVVVVSSSYDDAAGFSIGDGDANRSRRGRVDERGRKYGNRSPDANKRHEFTYVGDRRTRFCRTLASPLRKRLPCEVTQAEARPPGQAVGVGKHGHTTFDEQSLDGESREIAGGGVEQRDVGTAFTQVACAVHLTAEDDVDLLRPAGLSVGRQDTREQIAVAARLHNESHGAARHSILSADSSGADRGQCRATRSQQRVARKRQSDAAARTFQQLHTQPSLQLLDRLRQRRLGDLQALGSTPEVQFFCDSHKVPQLPCLEVIHSSTISTDRHMPLDRTPITRWTGSMITHTLLVSFPDETISDVVDQFLHELTESMAATGLVRRAAAATHIPTPGEDALPAFIGSAVLQFDVDDRSALGGVFADKAVEDLIQKWQARHPYRMAWVNHESLA